MNQRDKNRNRIQYQYRNLENFTECKDCYNTHHLYWYVICHPILYRCGVLYLFIYIRALPEPLHR